MLEIPSLMNVHGTLLDLTSAILLICIYISNNYSNAAFLDLWDSCILLSDYDALPPWYNDWENLCTQVALSNHPPLEEYGEPPTYRSPMMLLSNSQLSRRAVEGSVVLP